MSTRIEMPFAGRLADSALVAGLHTGFSVVLVWWGTMSSIMSCNPDWRSGMAPNDGKCRHDYTPLLWEVTSTQSAAATVSSDSTQGAPSMMTTGIDKLR